VCVALAAILFWRQSNHWIALLVALWLVLLVSGNLFEVDLLSPLVGPALATILASFSFNLLLALSFGISILRYRLWDIDTLINKTLVYGSLTGLLGAIYSGLIIGLESLAVVVTGTANEPVVLVISTLAIAALFLPARTRLQALIDMRFYRKKYDVEKTLAAFSAPLRQETDLEQIRERLLAAVQEAMEPAHVSLWLRQPERHPTYQAHGLESPGPILAKLSSDSA
jgi:hypothetical protein